ncbi:MAG: hypothetical protein S4CHLAM102_06000 [Chlamydiia bacterium]|nr:hypothetical protein [Chlamydiia bacterium]
MRVIWMGFLLLCSLVVAKPLDQEEFVAWPDWMKSEKFSASGFKLNLTEQDKKSIYFIIHSMGNDSTLTLAFKSGRLNKAGKEIDHVPTLQFLAYIFTTPDLIQSMVKIERSSLWSDLMGSKKKKGVAAGLQKQKDNGELEKQLKGFSEFTHGDYKTLEAMAQKNDWDGFVRSLIKSNTMGTCKLEKKEK